MSVVGVFFSPTASGRMENGWDYISLLVVKMKEIIISNEEICCLLFQITGVLR